MSLASVKIQHSPVFRLALGIAIIVGALYVSLYEPIAGVIVASVGGWLIGGLRIYVEWKEHKLEGGTWPKNP